MDPNLTKPSAPPQTSGSAPGNPEPVISSSGNLSDQPAFPWTSNPPLNQNPVTPTSIQTPASTAEPSAQVVSPPPSPLTVTPEPQIQPQALENPFFPPPVDLPRAQIAVNQSLPPPPPQEIPISANHPQNKKFPYLIVTSLILLTITGFSGSYLYFRASGKDNTNQNLIPKITPPVKEALTPLPTLSEDVNPFDNKTYENPFSNESTYVNPFGEDETDMTNEPYVNPFENLEE